MAFWSKKKPSRPPQPVTPEHVSVIEAACEGRSPLTLIVPDERLVVPARFIQVEDEVLTVQIVEEGVSTVDVPAMVCITFLHRRRPTVFLGGAVASFLQDGLVYLLVQMPDQIAGAEARIAFRIPVYDDTKLRVTVAQAPACEPPVVRDISPVGACIAYPRLEDPQFAIGDTLSLTFAIGNERAEVEAVITRSRKGVYGVRFPESLVDGVVKACPELTQVVRLVERHWLARRRTSAASAA